MKPEEIFDLISDRKSIWLDPLGERADYLTEVEAGIPMPIWRAAFAFEYSESTEFREEVQKRLKEEAGVLVDLAMKIIQKPEVKTASVEMPKEEAEEMKEKLSPKAGIARKQVIELLKEGPLTIPLLTRSIGCHFTVIHRVIKKYVAEGKVSIVGKGERGVKIYGLAGMRKSPHDVRELILRALKDGPLTQSGIVAKTELSQSTVKDKLTRLLSSKQVCLNGHQWSLA